MLRDILMIVRDSAVAARMQLEARAPQNIDTKCTRLARVYTVGQYYIYTYLVLWYICINQFMRH